jgi:endonuclease/exonuclease/phosphatase family metal-dependent hydrolase
LKISIAAVCAGAALVIAPAASAKPVDVTVMTRNLDLGTDLVPIAIAQPGDPFEQAVANAFNEAKASNFEARMAAVAREIAAAKPDVVGLQEATSWLSGPKNDPAAAEKVEFEHLKSLMGALEELHAPYRLVDGGGGIDLEGASALGLGIRIKEDESAMLVRRGLKVVRHQAHPFKNLLKIPTRAAGTVTVTRSWSALDLVKGGRRFRVVDTHLEAYLEDTRTAQAKELLKGPLRTGKTPVILIGDLNSRPDSGPGAYKALTRAGLAIRRTPKFSCCWGDAKSPNKWDHNVDWIMARPAKNVKLERSFVTGAAKLPEGVYPSDHGGVVSRLTLR